MDDNEKLKSCPFCGGVATTTSYEVLHITGRMVVCKECSCMLKPLVPFKTDNEAIEMWNNRV